MPTSAEFIELYDNCTHEWTSLNGVNGILFTSNLNGKTLFFAAAGLHEGTSLNNRGSNGYYWSSTYHSAMYARILRFSNSDILPQNNYYRREGFVIRAVKDGTPNRSIIPPTSDNEPREEETPTVEEPKDDNER